MSHIIMHAADVHIGDSRNLPNYLGRQEQMLKEFTRIAIENEVCAQLFAGDIFDAKHMLDREKDMFLRWLIENDKVAQRHNFDVVMMNGNHDEIEEGYTHLRKHKILADYGLLKRTIIVEDEPQLVGPFDSGSSKRPRIYIAALPAKHYKGEEINFAISAIRKKLDAKLREEDIEPWQVYFVAMIHESIYGAQNEAGTWSCKKGPKLDPELAVDYWALGDIHAPFQRVMPNAWYPGSPIQHDFGDLDTKRGVLVVDLDFPEDPKKTMVEGVTPLITVSDKPDEWPEDAIIRFEGTADEITDTVFPENVVRLKPVVNEDVRAVVNTDGHDMLEGLAEVLVEQNVPEDYQEGVVEEIEAALSTL